MTAAAPIDMATMRARREEAQRNAAALRQMVRYRLDYRWNRDGKLTAILTVALADGHLMRFTSSADPREVAGAMGLHPEVGFGFLKKAWKGIKKITKKVATSGVFKVASTALAAAAPLLGPIAPAALAASAGMKATTALLAARQHSAAGNKDAAAKLVQYASTASNLGDKIQLKAAVKTVAPKLKAAAKKPGAKLNRPKLLPKGVSFAKPAKPATVPLGAAVRDHAQAASGKLYTMLLKPA